MSIHNKQVKFIWVKEGNLPSNSISNALYFLEETRKIHVNGISFGTNDNDFITYLANDSNKTINGNLTIGGDLTVGGETTIINATELQVLDQIITVAKDNSSNLVGYAGLEIPKYNGTDTLGLVMRSDGILRIGKLADKSKGPGVSGNNLQAVLTRDDDPQDGGIFFWNASQKKAISLTPSEGKFLQSGKNVDNDVPTWTFLEVDDIKDAGSVGKSLLKSDTKAAARAAIGAGTGNGTISSVELSSGTNPGTLKIKVDTTDFDNIAVTGLKGAAYQDVTHFALASHSHGKIENDGRIKSPLAGIPTHVALFDQNPTSTARELKSIALDDFRKKLGSGDSGFLSHGGSWTTNLGDVSISKITSVDSGDNPIILFNIYGGTQLKLGDPSIPTLITHPDAIKLQEDEDYGEAATVEYVKRQISWEVY